MIAAILAVLVLCQAHGGPVGGDVSVIPNGVRIESLPRSPGFNARGERARLFIEEAQAIVRGDPEIPDRSGAPWLILIGPEEATRQAEGRIPEELKTRIQVTRYEPDDPRLERGFRRYYQGGMTAILLAADRSVEWSGLFELAELLLRIRRLLGLEPEPPPLIPLPSLPGGADVFTHTLAYLAGLLTTPLLGLGLWGFAWVVSRVVKAQVAQQMQGQRPN